MRKMHVIQSVLLLFFCRLRSRGAAASACQKFDDHFITIFYINIAYLSLCVIPTGLEAGALLRVPRRQLVLQVYSADGGCVVFVCLCVRVCVCSNMCAFMCECHVVSWCRNADSRCVRVSIICSTVYVRVLITGLLFEERAALFYACMCVHSCVCLCVFSTQVCFL